MLALLSGLLLTDPLNSDDDDTPVDPEEPEIPPDIGATFDQLPDGAPVITGGAGSMRLERTTDMTAEQVVIAS